MLGAMFVAGILMLTAYFIFDSSWFVVGVILLVGMSIYGLMTMFPSQERIADETVRSCIHKKTLHTIVFDPKVRLKSRAERSRLR